MEANDKDPRVRLRVLGISYSQIQSGAYALILADINGPLRMPVVVGGMEAQAIAIRLEGITPPRPLTHDLLSSMMHAFEIQLVEVFIYKFEEGIYYSQLTMADNYGREVLLDARTSDAIALAMRTNAPIFTTRDILISTGFMMEVAGGDSEARESEDTSDTPSETREETLARLRKALAEAIDNEEYERAANLQKKISGIENENCD